MSRGRFVVLEGIDGSGTTTQLERVAAVLRNRGHRVRSTCEPSSGPVGQLLRDALGHRLVAEDGSGRQLGWECLALLFAADRMDHVRSEIEPALAQGWIVLSDRYDLSSRIYQSVTAREPEAALDFVLAANRFARRPDLTFVLELPAEVAELRRSARGGERELFERRDLQLRLAREYQAAARYAPEDRLVSVDATGTVDEVTAAIIAELEIRLGIK